MNSRTLLIAGAWLASIALTYSLGQLQNPEASPSAAGGSAGGVTPQANGLSSAGNRQPALSPLALPGGGIRGAAETVESVTGGESLEDWLKRLLNQDDEIVRASAFLRLLETLNTPEDLRKALDIVAANGGRDRWRGGAMKEATMLLQKWTQMDAKGAAEFANGKTGGERLVASSIVLGTWTRSNPEEALAFAKANGVSANAEDGNWSVAAVVAQLSKTDVDRALQVAATEDRSRARGRMMDSVLSELFTQRGEDGAKNTVMSLPDGPFRDGLTPQLASRLADKDGPGTAQWVMGSLPAGEVRSMALAEVINEWAEDDAVAAGNFLSQLPASPESDPARERYANDVLRRDPEGALAWAGTISSDKQRARAVENLVRAWMRRDKAAAERWVESAQLSDQVRNQLLRR